MSTHFVQSLRDEIEALERELSRDARFLKLKRLQEVLALYAGVAPNEGTSPGATDATRRVDSDAPVAAATALRAPPIRMASELRQRAETLAVEFLRGLTRPTPTREIHEMLLARGIELGGKQPTSNLSAILSKNEKVHAVGRSGWVLVGEGDASNESITPESEPDAPQCDDETPRKGFNLFEEDEDI